MVTKSISMNSYKLSLLRLERLQDSVAHKLSVSGTCLFLIPAGLLQSVAAIDENEICMNTFVLLELFAWLRGHLHANELGFQSK